MQTPLCLGENWEFYYCNKFSVYNLTLSTKQAYCFAWDESVIRRGANKIASCLSKLIELHCSSDSLEVSLFADNYRRSEQVTVVNVVIVVLQFQNIQSMKLFFLNCGHMQNENDSIHSVIERNKKGVSIYHPYQWITLIEGACKSKP